MWWGRGTDTGTDTRRETCTHTRGGEGAQTHRDFAHTRSREGAQMHRERFAHTYGEGGVQTQ